MHKLPTWTLWWGCGLSLVGALLDVFAPNAAATLAQAESGDPQLIADVLFISTRLFEKLVMPLGAALIAAALVMRYVDWRFRATNADSRPAPIRFPSTRDVDEG